MPGVVIAPPLAGGGRACRGGGPLQQPLGQRHVPFRPGTQSHRPAGIVKALAAIPEEDLAIPFMAVAGQAGGYAIFGHAGPPAAAGLDVVDGLRGVAAIDAATAGALVERIPPASGTQLGAEIFQENAIPSVHGHRSIAEILPAAKEVSMCRRLHFPRLTAPLIQVRLGAAQLGSPLPCR